MCSVVEILELFNHPSEELKLALQSFVDLFNPRDYCYIVSQVSQTPLGVRATLQDITQPEGRIVFRDDKMH